MSSGQFPNGLPSVEAWRASYANIMQLSVRLGANWEEGRDASINQGNLGRRDGPTPPIFSPGIGNPRRSPSLLLSLRNTFSSDGPHKGVGTSLNSRPCSSSSFGGSLVERLVHELDRDVRPASLDEGRRSLAPACADRLRHGSLPQTAPNRCLSCCDIRS